MERKSTVINIIWKVLLITYLALLIIFGLFYIYDGRGFNTPAMTFERISTIRKMGYWNMNLIPLSQGTMHYIKTAVGVATPFESVNYHYAAINVFGNLFKFMPLAILLPLAYKAKKFGWVILRCLIAALLFETLQFVTMLGYFDIDDIWMNMLGCALGYGVYSIFAHIRQPRLRFASQQQTNCKESL